MMVIQHLFRDVATLHMSEFCDGLELECVTHDYSVTPNIIVLITTEDYDGDATEKVVESKYKARFVRHTISPLDVCHYDLIHSLPKTDTRATNLKALYYQIVLLETCTLQSGKCFVKMSEVTAIQGLHRGRGLFAHVMFRKGDIVGWYPCTPGTTNHEEGATGNIGAYGFKMVDTGITYDNYAESQKISAEEDPTTHCCSTLVREATKMGLGWLINTSKLKKECNTEHMEKEVLNPDARNIEVFMKVRIVVATKDIAAGDEIVMKHLDGDLLARSEAERDSKKKAQNRTGYKGVVPKTSTPTPSEGPNTESATNGIAGVGNGVRQKSDRAAKLKVKDEEKVAAEKIQAAERDKLQEKAKEEKSKKRAKENELEEKAKKAKTDKESQRAVGKRTDDVNISATTATTKQEPAVRPVGIKTTDDLQTRNNHLEILNTNQENTIKQLKDELRKQKADNVGLLETQKQEFEQQLQKLELQGKVDAAEIALNNANKIQTLQEALSLLQVQVHGYRVASHINAPALDDHANDASYEKHFKRLQEAKAAGFSVAEMSLLQASNSSQRQAFLNTLVESPMTMPLPQSHAIQPFQQNALPAIQQNAVLAIEANAAL